MNIDNAYVEKIKNYLLEKIDPFIIYIFGSSVDGIFREDSDIDIAFISDKKFSEYELFIIAQELADILKREVDFINLDNASTVFKAQVVGKGKVIYCSDDTRRMYFEMYSFKDYALLNEERAEILDGIRRRGSVYGKWRNMVGFRNIAVHNYQAINLKGVQEIIENHIDDLKEFTSIIINKI